MSTTVHTPRRVLILAAAPAQLLDIAGPAEILAQASRLGRPAGSEARLYDIACHVVPEPGTPATSAGLPLGSTLSAEELLGWSALDTLIVAGGEGARRRGDEAAIRDLTRHLAARARRVVGVCTGAFILAAAGCLNGRRVTTHWRWCDELARRHPGLAVDPEPIYVQDGRVWTSAGITAGMDLALALVEADHGHALALAVARELVMFLRRPGSQKQFSPHLSAQNGLSARLADLPAWMSENLHRPLRVETLAARVGLSPRQFARAFRAEAGTTPARMLERLRVEAARRMLESDGAGLTAVATLCGFQADETMRRAFLRHVGVPPGDYRDRFRAERRLSHHEPSQRSMPA
ncbi:GlxA family transcriptional regulator [Methylobacterium dankookense]|uniref:HTH-type transcriptional activator RhaS n=1 Tax=Methylobacterium dankookense TaxID=560405 RepID=A0A564FSD4_9HYPH|nr:helix-turn-helix domain-containing protein [Methylobacterium dankookense]GJD56868.1 HTH-type transcriptional activator RhaS [Methylobacterium dankookense]VUF10728.1 HTH-type transcriptional regulator CdhR [Methylobacterium dankookense]